MTLFDLIALVVVLISGLVGFSRGAVRELVTVLAFGLAALAALYLLPFAGPIARRAIHTPWVANAAAVALVFICAYIALRLAGGWLSAHLQTQTTLGGLDRCIGLAFGVVRGLIVLGVFYLVFTAATPRELTPVWFTGAKVYPLARESAQMLESLAPQGIRTAGRLGPALQRAAEADSDNLTAPADPDIGDDVATPSSKPHGRGYDRRSRSDFDALVERSR